MQKARWGTHEAGAASYQAAKSQRLASAVSTVGYRSGALWRELRGCVDANRLTVRADQEFMSALTRAASSIEPVYAASEHVELQIYGGVFFSDGDLELCRQFHGLSWERRSEIAGRFSDQRLKRLARRLIYFESPHLIDDADRRIIADDIAARRRGEGNHASPPWTTIAQALAELEAIDTEVSAEFRRGFLELR
jgi:exodeoxyribonuclease I